MLHYRVTLTLYLITYLDVPCTFDVVINFIIKHLILINIRNLIFSTQILVLFEKKKHFS